VVDLTSVKREGKAVEEVIPLGVLVVEVTMRGIG